MGSVGLGRASKSITRLGRRQGTLRRLAGAIQVVGRVVEAVFTRFIVNVIAVGVACTGRGTVTIDAFPIRTRFIKTVTIRVAI